MSNELSIPFMAQGEETPAPKVEVAELQALMQACVDQQEVVDAAEKVFENEKARLSELKFKLTKMLGSCGMRTFTFGDKVCTIAKTVTLKNPQGDAKLAFFEELKKRGQFDDLISVNSKTLNAWYKKEFGVSIDDQGEIVYENGVPEVPGLEFPTITEQLRITKKRGKK